MDKPPEGSDIAALLNIFQYLNYKPEVQLKENLTMADIFNDRSYFESFYPSQERQYRKLLAACADNPDFANIVVLGESVSLPDPQTGKKYELGGLKAGFYGDQRTGAVYAAFRGTGRREWLDNALASGGLTPASPQQMQALVFFDAYIGGMAAKMQELSGKEPYAILTGHSKGGNKAQFAAMLTKHQDIVRAGISMDGQTMAPETMEHMIDALGMEKFEKLRTEKLASVCGTNDFVHPLCHNAGDHRHADLTLPSALIPPENTVYLKMDGAFGLNPANLHMPDAYVTGTGRLTALSEKGALVKLMENISASVMHLPPAARSLVTESVMWTAQFVHRAAPLGKEQFSLPKFAAGLNLFVVSASAGLVKSLPALTLELARQAAKAAAALVAGVMTRSLELINEAGKLGQAIKEMARRTPDLAGAAQLGTALTDAAQAAASLEVKPFAAMSFAERVQWAKERSAQGGRPPGLPAPAQPAPPGRLSAREL
ncbi:MAG: DUF2974 domain-containing protein [Gracilibacteraceae bacterium]|jgi:hypothetical protein|nr:DUF2974 domain-containing protein [Gracilibacteraceae bacterium]